MWIHRIGIGMPITVGENNDGWGTIVAMKQQLNYRQGDFYNEWSSSGPSGSV